MIFVTVGTHEQPFNRLLEEIDKLVENKVISEEIVCQSGYSTYSPKHFTCQKFFDYKQMNDLFTKARLIICHGGPSSFIAPLSIGKVPIVVPRQKQFGEHINGHQLTFCKELYNRGYNIIVIEDIANLDGAVLNYDKLIETNKKLSSNNDIFQSNLKTEILSLYD